MSIDWDRERISVPELLALAEGDGETDTLTVMDGPSWELVLPLVESVAAARKKLPCLTPDGRRECLDTEIPVDFLCDNCQVFAAFYFRAEP